MVLGQGLPSETPTLGAVLAKDFLSFTPAQVVFFFPDAAVKGSPHGAEQKASVWAQGSFQALVQSLASFPCVGEKLIEMWERDVRRNREKMPKKNGLFRKCAGEVGGTFFPIFKLLLGFIQFTWS